MPDPESRELEVVDAPAPAPSPVVALLSGGPESPVLTSERVKFLRLSQSQIAGVEETIRAEVSMRLAAKMESERTQFAEEVGGLRSDLAEVKSKLRDIARKEREVTEREVQLTAKQQTIEENNARQNATQREISSRMQELERKQAEVEAAKREFLASKSDTNSAYGDAFRRITLAKMRILKELAESTPNGWDLIRALGSQQQSE